MAQDAQSIPPSAAPFKWNLSRYHLKVALYEDDGDSVMGRKAKPCLHCSILSEIGHQLETGVIDGQQALDDLVLVVADILATVPPDRVRGVIAGVIKTLPAAEARARERMKGRSTLQGKHG